MSRYSVGASFGVSVIASALFLIGRQRAVYLSHLRPRRVLASTRQPIDATQADARP
jgi:hypothetical protein